MTGSVEDHLSNIFDKFAKSYKDIKLEEKVLKPEDFISLLRSDNLKLDQSQYISQVASFLPLDSFSLLYIIADQDKKGYLTKADFTKVSKELLSTEDFDTNRLLFYLFKTIENDIYNKNSSLNSPISKSHLLKILHSTVDTKNDFIAVESFINRNHIKNDIDLTIFSQLLSEIPKIKLESYFNQFKNASDDTITIPQLKLISQSIFHNNLPSSVIDQIGKLSTTAFGETLSFDQSYKILKLVEDLPTLNYLIYQKISTDSKFDGNHSITSDSFFDFINKEGATMKFNEDEIKLFFQWNSLTLRHQREFSAIESSDMLAILTDDMIKSDESSDESFNFFPILNSMYSFILGSIAGSVGASMVYPIDIIKTRMQNQKGNSLYKSYGHCFKTLVKNEGFLGLYSGLLPQVIGVAPEKAIKLTVNDFVRNLGYKYSSGNGKNGGIDLNWEILAGSSAGACQVIFTNPLEITKIRLQMQGEQLQQLINEGKSGVRKNAIDIIRELGLKGLYKGAGACMLRDIPFSSIYFPTYSNIKKYLFKFDPYNPTKRNSLESWELLISGALAGLPAAYLTTPCDVIKTRLQSPTKPHEKPYTSILNVFTRILKDEGPRAFFKGGLARICKSSPQFGFTLATYELFQNSIPLKRFYPDSSLSLPVQAPLTDGFGNKLNSLTPSLNKSEEKVQFNLTENAKKFVSASLSLNPSLLSFAEYYKSLKLDEKK